MSEIQSGAPSLRTPVEDSVPSILRAAADLIEPKGAWWQGSLAGDGRGNYAGARSPEARCWCVWGAIMRIAGGPRADEDAYRALAKSLGRSVPGFNDDEGTTQAMAVAALRAAADQAEALTSTSNRNDGSSPKDSREP